MKKNKPVIIVAIFFMAISIGIISIMSIRVARTKGYSRWPLLFSFGGRAALKNTIEISLEDAESLELEYGSKNIKIYPADDNKITIKEYLYSDKASAEVIYGADKRVKVTGKNYRSFVICGFFGGKGERIEVYIPEKSLKELSLVSGSGNITSEADTVREDGVFMAQAGSGNVDAKKLTGEKVFLKTSSGNVSADELTGNNFFLKAGSGNVTANVVNVTGNMELEAGSGNVKLELPKEMAFHFNGNTGSGNIRTDFDEFLSYNKKGNSAEGDVGNKKSTIEISAETNSGNVRVLYR